MKYFICPLQFKRFLVDINLKQTIVCLLLAAVPLKLKFKEFVNNIGLMK